MLVEVLGVVRNIIVWTIMCFFSNRGIEWEGRIGVAGRTSAFFLRAT